MPNTIEERLRKLRARQSGQSIEERLAALRAQRQQPPQESYYQQLKRNLGLGFEYLGQKAADVGMTAYEIGSSALRRDLRPLRETMELAGRAALNFASANPTAPGVGVGVQLAQAPAMQAVERQQAARREAAGDVYFRGAAIERAKLDERAAKDPSLLGRVTRFAPQTLPYVGAGVASGGSIPVMAATGAVMSLDEPESLPLNVATAAIPLPAGGALVRGARDAIRRTLGRGAAQVIEAEARQAATLPVRGLAGATAPTLRGVAPSISGQIRAVGPAIEEAAIRARGPSANLNAAINAAAAEVPESMTRRILGELSSFPRAMMSSLDISAPGRQGLLLAVAPSRWGAAMKAGRQMFQAFSPKHYDRITREIVDHVDAPLAEKSGLYLAMRQSEEFFTSRLASKVPGVSASQRAYETYLDSLRMSTFSQYKGLIDKSGLAGAEAQKAYSAAAQWINVATGRGSFGAGFDKAVPFLSNFLFAPRYAASRFNVLNPKMYIDNFRNPITRVVAKQQMKDLATYLGAVATTFGLAKAAGADVSLNPGDRDFLKIRAGNKVFDPGAGLTQVVRFAVRASQDLFRAAKGEKSEPFKDAGSLTLNFLRSKTAPIPSYVWDFFSRRTYTGKEFTSAKDRAIGALERVAPLTWSDFTEALWNEGLGSALATLPGAVGIGVQSYNEPGGFIEQAAPLLREYTRAGRQLPEIRRIKGEADQQFDARVKVFGEALSRYGAQLVESQEYRQADTATKDKALDLLPRRISSALIKQNESWQLQPRVIMSDVRESQQNRR